MSQRFPGTTAAGRLTWESGGKPLALCAPAAHLSYAAHAEVVALTETCRRQLEAICTDYGALLVPSAQGEAPAGLEATGVPFFNRMWTLIHTSE